MFVHVDAGGQGLGNSQRMYGYVRGCLCGLQKQGLDCSFGPQIGEILHDAFPNLTSTFSVKLMVNGACFSI